MKQHYPVQGKVETACGRVNQEVIDRVFKQESAEDGARSPDELKQGLL